MICATSSIYWAGWINPCEGDIPGPPDQVHAFVQTLVNVYSFLNSSLFAGLRNKVIR